MLILSNAAHVNAKSMYSASNNKNELLSFNMVDSTTAFDFDTSYNLPQQEPSSPPVDDAKQKSEPTPEATVVAQTPITHTVVAGDNLSKIAALHQTSWVRLFDKNVQIENPDHLTIGEVITIPSTDEQLPQRATPQPVVPQQVATPQYQSQSSARRSAPVRSVGSSAGNTYAAGYCTWYAKSRRPDLPNRMGNAISWVSSARASGFATGNTPQAGAIGQQGNHVVYVESVNGDGTITVSEMNYKGLGIVSSRTVAASNFTYIY